MDVRYLACVVEYAKRFKPCERDFYPEIAKFLPPETKGIFCSRCGDRYYWQYEYCPRSCWYPPSDEAIFMKAIGWGSSSSGPKVKNKFPPRQLKKNKFSAGPPPKKIAGKGR